eukprot:TRINITY_DN344_c3_g1_i1.p1 TRINITY_DN344_c3_g1~~TRINITY_DN344_c3_g1_i1.p1  ORF type:complete len:625 (+),score=106.20 TRINITY_DN344_c3_g1_i1:120-1994(+)
MSEPQKASHADPRAEQPSRPPAAPQQPAQRIKIGMYVLGETLGKGSFGKVKLAVHETSGHKVAIKILNRQKIKHSQMDKKIRREIKILKLFRHPHIIRLYEVIETSTDILMCMEYVSGGELFDYIVQRGKLPEPSARRFFHQIISGVEYCHFYNVVHRDLKPENLLLDRDLNVKIADFGLSNLMRDGDFLKTSCGSPNYAAPEVISGKLYAGPEVDVWSCGVILYALLCGRLPFDEESIPALFKKIKEGRYPSPHGVSTAAREVIQTILHVDPLQRVTIPQLRETAWFKEGLAPYLSLRPSELIQDADSVVDMQVVQNVAQKLGMTTEEVLADLQSETAAVQQSHTAVAYQILTDHKRRREFLESAQRLQTAAPSGGGAASTAPAPAQSEMSVGPMARSVPSSALGVSPAAAGTRLGDFPTLTSSPVMDSVLMPGQHNLRERYNRSRFVTPSSLRSAVGVPMSMSSSPPYRWQSVPGDFVRGPSPGSISEHFLGRSVGSSPQQTSGASPIPPGLLQREGSIEGLQDSGWRLGLLTELRSADVMAAIYEVAEKKEYTWKVLAPFHLCFRQQDHQEGGPKVGVRLYRVQDRHDKGFILDFVRVDGPLLPTMDMIAGLYDALRLKLG